MLKNLEFKRWADERGLSAPAIARIFTDELGIFVSPQRIRNWRSTVGRDIPVALFALLRIKKKGYREKKGLTGYPVRGIL